MPPTPAQEQQRPCASRAHPSEKSSVDAARGAHGLLALIATTLVTLAATPSLAADTPPVRADPPDSSCQDNKAGADCIARKQRDEEDQPEAEAKKPAVGGLGLLSGGNAIVPCTGSASTGAVCGVSSTPPTITRSPLTVRRLYVSAGIDHALSDRWAVGGWVGYERGRLHRLQSESTPGVMGEPDVKDTTIRTRSTTMAAALTWFAAPDVSIDGILSAQRTKFDFERLDTPVPRLFVGANAGHGWGLSVLAARAWRSPGSVLVPEVGLDYVDSSVDPLAASIPNPPPGSLDNFRVSEQRTRALSALLGVQLQWPRSTSFGVLLPYARAAGRWRLLQRNSPVVATADGKPPVSVDPDTQTSRQAVTLAAGLLAQLPAGVALFGDLGHTRGAGDLRETRLSVGIKFER